MSGRLIADDAVERANQEPVRVSREVTSFGRALASPRGVLITVPLLILFVGVTLTVVGQRALADTSLSMARERFGEQSAFASQRIGQALEQADSVLDRMRDLERKPEDATDDFALALRDLIAGRPGMTQAYTAFPDGTFQGVYLESDGILRFQISRVGAGGGKFRHHTFSKTGLVWERDERTDYDPRRRAYYAVALKERARAWTAPYPFFTSQRTGITRVEPIYAANGTLLCINAVDFDTSALSAFMGRAEQSDTRSLVYAEGGVVLAYPTAAERIQKLKPTTHALNYKDIGDPLLDAFFSKAARAADDLGAGFVSLNVGGERFLGAVSPIGGAGGPRWHVVVFTPESSLLGALRRHRQESLVIAALALTLALLAAWTFARHIVRARRAVAVARAEADEATQRATELGSYRLVECLGKGGMGEVWRAEHRLLAREAAIKLINADLVRGKNSAEIQERFKREAQTIATLRSRNTVDLFDYGVTADGTFFYVMELLDGIDLESLIERYGPQRSARVVPLLIQVCNSLAEAHDAGLVHRDVKPANVFVCRAAEELDVVKVLDFGLVSAHKKPEGLPGPSAEASAAPTAAAPLTLEGTYLGTPTFIAPEQAMGLAVDNRADLYALGCVAWWLLAGRLVFPESDPIAQLSAHLTRVPPPLRPLVKGPLPAALEELIQACLRKEPAERPANARVIAEALRKISFEAGATWTLEESRAWWRAHVAAPKEVPLGSMDTVLSAARA
jgi:serine/threonine protein kinase